VNARKQLLLLHTPSTSSVQPISASITYMNTSTTNNLGADGMTWAQAKPGLFIVDAYGNYIMYVQEYSTGHTFVFSNDGGITWQDNTGNTNNAQNAPTEAFLTRGTMAYDSINDVIWVLSATLGEGILIRRFTFNRDVDSNISAINRTYGTGAIIDATASVGFPWIVWTNTGNQGTLIVSWRSDTSILAGFIDLGSDYTRVNTLSNWEALDGGTAFTTVAASTADGLAVSYKTSGAHSQSLWFCFPMITGAFWKWCRYDYSAGTWSVSQAATNLTTLDNGNGGYNLKYQLPTSFVFIGDSAFIGVPLWKDSTDGDTWRAVKIADDDSVSVVDAYSAGGTHSYAPTGDIYATTNKVIVAYIKTGAGSEYYYVKIYDTSLVQIGDEELIFDSAPVDIPLLVYDTGGTILTAFRDSVNTPTPPYHGWFGTITGLI